MKTCCGTYFRLPALMYWAVICLAFLLPGDCAYADTYEFSWTANHANDNVSDYEIYFRSTTADGYNARDFILIEDIELVYPAGVNEGIFVDEISEGFCFAIKAVDGDDFRSDFSENEDGRNKDLCNKNPNKLPFDGDTGNPQASSSSGGGGGGCFINQIK